MNMYIELFKIMNAVVSITCSNLLKLSSIILITFFSISFDTKTTQEIPMHINTRSW